MIEATILHPHSEREMRIAREMAMEITGKRVKVMGISENQWHYFQPWQSLDTIWVNNINSMVMQTYHEIAHWLVSSAEDRLKNNLMFGTAKKFGYDLEAHLVSAEKFENERLAGWAQHFMLYKCNQNPSDLVFGESGDSEYNVIKYINYLKTIDGKNSGYNSMYAMNAIEAHKAAGLINEERFLGFISHEDINAVIDKTYEIEERTPKSLRVITNIS